MQTTSSDSQPPVGAMAAAAASAAAPPSPAQCGAAVHVDGAATEAPTGARELPPSRRSARAAAAAAARPGFAGERPPPVVVPPDPPPPVPRAPTVVVAPNPEPTLLPRVARRSAEDPAPGDAPPTSALVRLRPRYWPLISLATVVLTVTAYTVAGSVMAESASASASPLSGGAPAPPFPNEGPPEDPAPRTSLPPELAATLASALPEAASAPPVADAGTPKPIAPAAPAAAAPVASLAAVAPAAAPAPPPRLPASPPPPAAVPRPPSPQLEARAAALRARLENRRSHATPKPPESERPATPAPSTPPPSAARSSTAPAPSAETLDPALPNSDATSAAALSAEIRPVTTFTHDPHALFAVATAPARVTDVALEAGERLVSRPTAGDPARWVITVLDSGPQTHVFVKPLRTGLRTNLTLTTDKRSYFLELSSTDAAYMAAVRFRYPIDDAAQRREALERAQRERQSTTAIASLQALSFEYRIETTAGAPRWKPTMVFDDGQKTFIRFPEPVARDPRDKRQAPILYVLRRGAAAYANYRVTGDLYVLDRVIDGAELRLTTPETPDIDRGIVHITRRSGAVGKGGAR